MNDERNLAVLIGRVADAVRGKSDFRVAWVVGVNDVTATDPPTVDISFDPDDPDEPAIPEVPRSNNYSSPAIGHRVLVVQFGSGPDDDGGTFAVVCRLADEDPSLGMSLSLDDATPAGPAGGDLTGNYPDPTIGPGKVTDAKVAAANKDGTAATPSMRTLGTGAQQAAAGNDSRLSDARAPTAHKTTHATGGSDVLTPADIGAVPTSEKGAANGVATLGAGGLVPNAQVPPLAITDTYPVMSEAAMLALSAGVGDVAVRGDLNRSFILRAEPATTLGNWNELLTPTDLVASVNGQVGVVSLPEDGAAGTASLRTLGTSGTQATAGNDARLSDARAPTAHVLDSASHTISGKTAGHVLKALSATTFGFAALVGSDLPATPARQFFRSGLYYPPPFTGSITTNAPGNGSLRAMPFPVSAAITADRIRIDITVVGGAGAVVRLGIYSDDGTGYPGALLLDAGTVTAETLGLREVTISQALAAGMYWVVCATQGTPSPVPTYTANGNSSPMVGYALGTTAPFNNYAQSSVTGALPANFSTTVIPGTAGPVVLLRAA